MICRKKENLRIRKNFHRLFPLLRSITGEGARRTHQILGEMMELSTFEVPSNTAAYDWVVPKEWKVNDAYLIDPNGKKLFSIHEHKLRLVNYSIPFRGTLSLGDLQSHLYTRPDLPGAIPYVTSYYQPRWGFCVTEEEAQSLPEGLYDVVVDTELFDGSMTMSHSLLEGENVQEVLFSTYTCHPQMANDELTGMLAMSLLYDRLANWESRKLSYRFVFVPEIIGSITYLSLFGQHLVKNLLAGLVVNNLGRGEPYRFKLPQKNDTLLEG